MTSESITDVVARQEWTEPIEEGLQKAVAGAFSAGGPVGHKVEDALHGTWLGHPLHPVLTDVPLGAWTAAIAMDAMDTVSGRDRYADGAEAAICIGLVGAAGSALAGLTDWHKTDGKPRRAGLVHGLLNLGATACFTASWVLRRRKERENARICSLVGYLIAVGSAYLGGSLVYRDRIGEDHTDHRPLPRDFVPVLDEAELPENTPRRVGVAGVQVLLVRRGDQVYALGEVCGHLGGPLAEGNLEDCSIRCPWHGSRFALDDGRVLEGPSTFPQPRYEARISNGRIEVRDPAPAAKSAE